jgi:hypothetical protein
VVKFLGDKVTILARKTSPISLFPIKEMFPARLVITGNGIPDNKL